MYEVPQLIMSIKLRNGDLRGSTSTPDVNGSPMPEEAHVQPQPSPPPRRLRVQVYAILSINQMEVSDIIAYGDLSVAPRWRLPTR